MKNVDIFRATISEFEHGDEQFNIERDRRWVSDRVAMMVQDWGIMADDFRAENKWGILDQPNLAPSWRDIGLVLRNWSVSHLKVDYGVLHKIIGRIFENEGAIV